MAVVSGMMQLQAFQESKPQIKEKLLDNVARISTMASIHEHLYQANNFASLNFSKNIASITEKIVKTMKYDTAIKVDTNFEPINLNVNQAIPCSLILSEVLTNALKHAFKNRSNGEVAITLSEKRNVIRLCIEDDGIGIQKTSTNSTNGQSLGMHLIAKLAKQLEGKYSYAPSEKGTSFVLTFKKMEVKGSASAHLYDL